MRLSAPLIFSTFSFSSLSDASFAFASFFIFSISSLLNPLPASIRIFCSLPVPLSLALTCRMPLASMSKVTSTCGTPRGAGGMPSRLKVPRLLFWLDIGLSPCNTCICTPGWLSEAVENTSDFFVGMVVLLSISLVITPPMVSIPRLNGVTSSNNTSLISPLSTAPCMAAPTATTSSGFTPRLGFLPKNFSTSSSILGIRLLPPTMITSSIAEVLMPASFNASSQGFKQRSNNLSARASNFARVNFFTRCLGTPSTAVI